MFLLDPAQRDYLEGKLKKTKDLSDWKRIFVLLGFDNGETIEDLADILRISPFTVENYIKEYRSKNKTHNDPRGGGHSKLDTDQSKELKDHLEKNTFLRVKHIIAYVYHRYNIKYSRSGMTAWLIQHGFTYKKPQKVPGKLDPLQQEQFLEEYKKLKSTLQADEEIYFIDAVHPEHQSQAVCGWIKKGEEKTLQTSGKQLRLHFAGALCLDGMKVFTKEYETVDAQAMVDFFKGLEEKSNAKTIHVIMDNAKANKNKLLNEYLKTSRIKPHYLPPYSPNLNAIERLWKIMRERKMYNRYYVSCKEFFSEIRGFFYEELHQLQSILEARINDKFQVVKLNPISLA